MATKAKLAATTASTASGSALEQRYNNLRKQQHDYQEHTPLSSAHDYLQAGLIWGTSPEGNPTPAILLIALEPGHWEWSREDKLDQLAYELLANVDDEWPVFACLADDKNCRYYCLFGVDGSDGTHSVDEIPPIELICHYEKLEKNPTFRWSMRIYTRLMHRFDAFHEQVFQTVKDRVSDKNEIIEEVAKLLFLETFRVHHKEIHFVDHEGRAQRLSEIFHFKYVRQHKEKAVEQIRAAFEYFKEHEDYIVISDDGSRNAIFPSDSHLRLAKPENYLTLLEAMQDLGPVLDNQGRPMHNKEIGTLADVAGDLLGRVFDVFLRANFESKGGLGVYLTPNPVKQAMLEIAMHDIAQETGKDSAMERLTAGQFRFCDPTCGSFGFGSVALNHIESLVDRTSGSDAYREKLKKTLRDTAFTGADAAPRMVMLARVNMALQGVPKAKIFYTDNSLTTKAFKPNSFDLICTNPPFGTPKFSSDKKGKESKDRYEAQMEQVLGGFRPTEVKQEYVAYYDYIKKTWVDTGDLELDDDGTPKWAGFRTDLRKVSTSKKNGYMLYPTTAGLALGSKPNLDGIWKPVGATIDPAVLFIDRCLQLLRPGGRLMIVLPDGVLCNSGDRYVREYIMGKKDEKSGKFHGGKAIVKAVISLPADTFKLSGTGAKTSILYLQKRLANPEQPELFLDEPQGDVFMAVAETLGYLVKNNIEDYAAGVPNDLDKIVGAYKRGE